MTLNQLPIGCFAIINSLIGDNAVLARQCGALGLAPGAKVQVLRRSRGKGPMQVKCLGTLFAIRADEAAQIRVAVE